MLAVSRVLATMATMSAAILSVSLIGSETCAAESTAGSSDAAGVASDAVVYGYSLITTEVTRVQMSNVSKAEGLQAPMGQFINIPRYPPANYRAVSAPNADTLYSLAWVDTSQP